MKNFQSSKLLWLVMSLSTVVILIVGSNRVSGPLTQQERIDHVTRQLACPTCAGESVYSSQAPAASAIRNEVARQIGTGSRSDDQIITYIQQRFGGQVLLVPSASGLESLVWSLPVAALVLCVYLLWTIMGRRSPISSTGSLVHKEHQRLFCLNSIADLDLEFAAGDLAEDEYLRLRRDYQQMDSMVTTSAKESSDPKMLRILSWVVVGALAIGAGLLVAQRSGQRLSGDSVTGSVENSTATMLSQARANNFVDPQAAIELYSQVLKLEPDNIEALTYRAWQLGLIARNASSEVKKLAYESVVMDLKRAMSIDSSYPDAHCFLGIIRYRLGDDAIGARSELITCQAQNPPSEVKGFVDSILAEVEAEIGG